ncbi:MAG TPA: HAD-IA family hydrolase, partial [Chloroflexota bacterium]|nr:HAD-IA family hydrolase [Chloroflexota bacterium]
VPEALAALQARGIRLGLVSNFAWRLPELVAALGIEQYFGAIVTSARAGYRKPRPEIFECGLAGLGARVERTLFVGDDPECDYQGAQSAGLRPLLINRKGRGVAGMETASDLNGIFRYF